MECELETAFLVGFHHLLDRAVGPEVELQLGPGSQLAADDGRAVGLRRLDESEGKHDRLRRFLGRQRKQHLVVEFG